MASRWNRDLRRFIRATGLSGALAAVCLAVPTAIVQPAPTRPLGVDDPARFQEALARQHDAGIVRGLPQAQARYRAALARAAAGDRGGAIALLEESVAFDPSYPDAHFTLARLSAFRDPGRSVGEMNEAFRILGTSYPWQRHLIANGTTGALLVWTFGLLLAVLGIVLRHAPHLLHMIQEVLSRKPTPVIRGAVTVIALAPLLWGLGLASTAALYAGFVAFRFGKREALVVALFVITSVGLVGGSRVVAPWLAPPSLEDPSLLVDRAMTTGYDRDVGLALRTWEGRDATEALYPFAYGTMMRRVGNFAAAEEHLTRAAALAPGTGWILTNLGNVYFAREEFGRAGEAYTKASEADPTAVEPHFNLAQVYTKQLLFAEASREQSRASALSFDRVRDFSRWSAPTLNRTVMDAAPPPEALWGLASRTAHLRAGAAIDENRFFAWLRGMSAPAPLGILLLPALFLLALAVGHAWSRGLPTLHCSNCQRIVCRRCVHRMQQRAFCAECHRSVKDLKSMEFTRLLLTRRDRSAARRRTLGQVCATFLVPGAGQMLRGATLSGFAAILVMVGAAIVALVNGALVPSLDVLPLPSPGWVKRIPLILIFLLIYATTVARFYAKTTVSARGIAPSAAPRPGTRPGRAAAGRS